MGLEKFESFSDLPNAASRVPDLRSGGYVQDMHVMHILADLHGSHLTEAKISIGPVESPPHKPLVSEVGVGQVSVGLGWDRLRRNLGDVRDGLGSVITELDDTQRRLDVCLKDGAPRPGHEVVRAYGSGVGQLLTKELPGSDASRAEDLITSESTARRIRLGEKILEPRKELEDLFRLIEGKTGRPLASEVKDPLRELGRAVEEFRVQSGGRRSRLKTAKLVIDNVVVRASVIINNVDAARAKVASIEEELADLVASARVWDLNTRRPILDPSAARREDELRRRLAEAKAELDDVLRQEHESVRELRDHAQKLSNAVGAYLRGVPPSRDRRGAARRRIVRRSALRPAR
jgi:hypothetical protein